jgi:predicted dehydrogenase
VHYFDLLADMAGAKCDTVYAQTWNPPWGEFAGDSQALVTMHYDNGTRAFFEGAKTNAWGLNCACQEYLRAECEGGTLILDHRKLGVFPYDPDLPSGDGGERQPEPLSLLEQPKWGHTWLIEEFVHWLDGGEPMETKVEDNLESLAIVFAAIESSRTGEPVKVQEFLGSASR